MQSQRKLLNIITLLMAFLILTFVVIHHQVIEPKLANTDNPSQPKINNIYIADKTLTQVDKQWLDETQTDQSQAVSNLLALIGSATPTTSAQQSFIQAGKPLMTAEHIIAIKYDSGLLQSWHILQHDNQWLLITNDQSYACPLQQKDLDIFAAFKSLTNQQSLN